jgi:hypothetical protein
LLRCRLEKNKNNKKQRKGGKSRPTVDISGTLQKFGIPVPRLPFLIGSSRSLGAKQSVYPNVSLSIPIIPQFLGIVAGGLTTSLALVLGGTIIENWTGFDGLFGECCLIGVKLELRVTGVTTPSGLVIAYFDEKSAAAPTAALALAAPHVDILVSNTESPSTHMISWMPQDYLDLEWSATSAPSTPVWFKAFAAAASTGTAAGTAGQVIVTGALQVAFRGYVV